MKLERDVIWVDFEATDVDTETARIVQIAATKIKKDRTREVKETLINPEVEIPEASTEVHGITNEMVINSPTFKQLSISLREWFEDCDLGTFNGNSYDIPLLNAELVRAGLEPIDWEFNTFDARILYQKLFPNTLSDIYKRLTGKELENAHNAQSDVDATIEIGDILLNKLLDENKDLEISNIQDLDLYLQGEKLRVDISGKLYKDVEGVIRYNFGKDRDLSVKENPGFARWMLNQSFAKETKDKLKQILNG
jgi:DNA polymerase-3 subunit epsilon